MKFAGIGNQTGMANELKDWIREELGNSSISNDSILVTAMTDGKTRIVLLNRACCQPSLQLDKLPAEISKDDIRQISLKLKHSHP
jgi:hypothetical protein